MKYQEEYRDPVAARKLQQAIRSVVTRHWTIMEVCGGQTHTIVKYGIDELLPPEVELVHGPGCPVCVTPLELIDKGIEIASRPDVIFCSFGDMLRVPGSRKDLFSVKAAGADVRIVYSPLDCLKIAKQNPNRTVVFFAVGFETTSPPNAMAVWQAKHQGIKNFAVLVSHVLVPPAMTAILSSPNNRVQGFLAAGHVCAVVGYDEYEPLARRFNIPVVITGFEPLDLLEGVYDCVCMLERGVSGVENQYARVVRREGNPAARKLINEVFETTDRKWRGIGTIPDSGLRLRNDFIEYDAERRFAVDQLQVLESDDCISGQILQGIKKPRECPAFGKTCTPEMPLGATMVSSEGACAAYYNYGRYRASQDTPIELQPA
ncbi:MAG TPA: hydrogenase formation protein HypD [Lacipirellulaceae bacterium]|jgi:hydrogenase expression/formation protein HypD